MELYQKVVPLQRLGISPLPLKKVSGYQYQGELAQAISFTRGTLKNMPDSLADISEHLLLSDGKYLRAGLVIASAMCGDYKPETARPLAAAVEILHLGTLIHDDIIDNADLRRGVESVPNRFGASTAVYTGDYLFTMVFSILSRHNRDRMEEVSDTVQKILLGEIRQNKHRYSYSASLLDYMRVVSGKTAALFAASMYAGAKDSGLPEDTARNLGRAGGYAGVMFQIVDDCLDLSPARQEADKPCLKDLQEGVSTLPVLYALAKNPSLRPLMQAAKTSEEVRRLAKAVVDEGGLAQALRAADKYYNKALAALSKVPDCEGRRSIEMIFDQCYHRAK